MRPFSARLPLLYRSMTAATSSSRVAMLTRLIAISPTPSRPGAFQMRQRINIREHFWRGNARASGLRAVDCRGASIRRGLRCGAGGRPPRSALSLESDAAAVAFDVHLEDGGVVDEPVDRGERHGGVREDLAPFSVAMRVASGFTRTERIA